MTFSLWRPHGRHRAIDRVRQLTAERDYLLTALTRQDGQMRAANKLIEDLTIENDMLRDDYDELFARRGEATAIAAPAIVDLDDTVPIPMPAVIPLSIAFAPNRLAA